MAGAAKYIAENETDLTKNPNRAHFAITQPTALQAVQYSFAGFLPAQNPADDVNLKAGVRSYFRPSIILRCLVYTDSEWSADYLGEFAIDGDPASIWHTASGIPYPHEIQVDLGAEYPISGIGILPRQSPTNAKVKDHEIFLSSDGITWLVQGGGTFNYDNESYHQT